MKYTTFKIAMLGLFVVLGNTLTGQNASIFGKITDKEYGKAVQNVEVILEPLGEVVETDIRGEFQFEELKAGKYKVLVRQPGFVPKSQLISLTEGERKRADFQFDSLNYLLEAVVIEEENSGLGLDRLSAVDGMGIYAGKKNEVIRIDGLTANLATNNARQVFSRVAGLNIWESDGAGLQLGIGGRGLSPNRTSNFNSRQNGYDISADALGYPESYYTPPTEALERIEVVRGAASLQYGTQFGGMLNFVFKEGPRDRKIQFTTRQTAGSWGLFNSFNSLGGTVGKLNYYGFYQFKRGNGWRPNSGFRVHTAFGGMRLAASKRLSFGLEYTFMDYIAQQPGGLTDALFNQNPRQSIRERNWFQVQWNLAALTADYKFNARTKLNVRNFGLLANRDALGFLGLISRVDPLQERNLIHGYFRNFGNETRLIHKYDLRGNPSALLVGARYYQGYAINQQGNANDGYGPDFYFLQPDSLDSDYHFPSRNIAAFAENMFALTPHFSLTPGIRFEHIYTSSAGYFVDRATDLAGNIIFEQRTNDAKQRTRNLVLMGLGASFKPKAGLEIYGNFSQNYRAINFNDLRIANPNFRIDENLQDEKGFNSDLGIRGELGKLLTYDVSLFYLWYKDRIGLVLKSDSLTFNTYRYRTNVADSRNLGVESFVEMDLLRLIKGREFPWSLALFSNLALIDARYIHSDEIAINNKKVELVPSITFKTGLNFAWKSFKASWQFSYTGQHFTDATNSTYSPNAVNGLVPAYYVTDLSLSYKWRMLTFEGGLNNLTNNLYFTRRAAAYPGPGIIPSDGRSFYVTVQAKF
ncbi:MAG: TonB-dependent receptor [Bacteroidia bacterium]|nr:TonB-dependent receptor [Bacteroidia bacterium]